MPGGVARTVTFLGGKWFFPATVGTSESLNPVNYYVQNGTTFVTDSWAGTPTYTGGAIPRSTINADDSHSSYNDIQADMNFNYTTKNGITGLLLVGFEHRNSPGYTITYKSATGKEGRVFTTTYGGSGDLVNDGFRRMMLNGCLWAAGLEAKITTDLKTDLVGPYNPSWMKGRTRAKDVKPQDLSGWDSPIWPPVQ